MKTLEIARNRYARLRHRFFLNRERFGARGENVTIYNGSIMQRPENIFFGKHIYIGPEAYFYVEDARLIIHDNVIFGPRVSLTTTQHRWREATALPFGCDSEKGDIEIFSHVWVGMYSMLLPGVRIGEGAICAAGAVVYRNVPPLAIVSGNPAQIRGYRDPAEYLKLKTSGQTYGEMLGRSTPPVYTYHAKEPLGTLGETDKARAQREQFGIDFSQFEG